MRLWESVICMLAHKGSKKIKGGKILSKQGAHNTQAKAMGRNLVRGLCSSRESLVRCVLKTDFAFSTFPEDWGL